MQNPASSLRAPAQLLGGRALPPAEWHAAERNAKRLIIDLESHGRLLATHDLFWLGEAYRAQGWNLARSLDARWWPHDSHERATLILALLDEAGGIAAAAAVRWIWLHGSLKEAHESGAFFFGDYAAAAMAPDLGQGVRVRVSAAMAEQIFCCGVVYSCGLHARPGTPEKASWRLVRLAHLLAGMNWHFSWLIGRSEPAIARRWNEAAWGLSFIENGIYVQRGDGTRETAYHLVGARIDHLRRQFQRPEYGDGAASLADHLPLLEQMEGRGAPFTGGVG